MMQRGPMVSDLRPNKPSPSQNHSVTNSPNRARPSPSHRSPPSKSPNDKIATSSKSQASSIAPGSMPLLNFEEEHKVVLFFNLDEVKKYISLSSPSSETLRWRVSSLGKGRKE